MHNNDHHSTVTQDEFQVLRQRIAELELERVAYQQELSALRAEVVHAGEFWLKAIFDNAAVSIWLTDRAGNVIAFNPHGARQLGYTAEELIHLTLLQVTHPDDRATMVAHMQQLLRGEINSYRIEKRFIRKDGGVFWADLSVTAVRDTAGQIEFLVGIAIDITERKLAEEQLQSLNEQLQQHAIRDALTGLYNRRYLNETLPRELQYAERHRQAIGVLMLDIDHFKYINDTYGHDAGDALLRAIGAFLRNNIRSADIACRYGGEEFTLVLAGATLYDTWQRAEDIRTGVKALVVQHQYYALNTITASLGVAVFPDHSMTAEGLLKAADQALYKAKRSGRDRVVVATGVPSMNGTDGSL